MLFTYVINKSNIQSYSVLYEYFLIIENNNVQFVELSLNANHLFG